MKHPSAIAFEDTIYDLVEINTDLFVLQQENLFMMLNLYEISRQ